MVSVIMPTYNHAGFVQAAIESVLGQSYKQLELIIIDDGSDDGTAAIIQNVHDPRVRYFRMAHTGSPGKLRNTGIGKAQGDFIAFIDSDDTWDLDKLEKQVQLLETNSGAGYCICDVRTMRAGTIENRFMYPRNDGVEVTDLFRLLKKNETWIFPSTLLFRKSELAKTGPLNDALHFADYDFTVRLAYHSPAVVVYQSLVTRRIHQGNRSAKDATRPLLEMMKIFEDLYRSRMLDKNGLNYVKWSANFRLGEYYRRTRNYRSARRRYLSAARYRPFQWRNYWRILQSI